jgi:regulator of replication initiation timing
MERKMPKQKINERTVEALHAEIDYNKTEKALVLRENDSLRTENVMLKELLTDITSNEDIWTDDVPTKTLLWRLKNILNNLN